MIYRVRKLGTSGYEFEHPAYVRDNGTTYNQISLIFLVMDERDLYGLLKSPIHTYADPRSDPQPYSAPLQHLECVTDGEAAMAEALYALNGGAIFVKPVTKVSEGEDDEHSDESNGAEPADRHLEGLPAGQGSQRQGGQGRRRRQRRSAGQ